MRIFQESRPTLYLLNDGGSHHLATARLLAKQLGAPLPVQAPVVLHSLDISAVMQLTQMHAMFVLPDSPAVFNKLHEGFGSDLVTYHRAETPFIPKYGTPLQVLLLPREDRKCAAVARLMRTAGFTDLGEHLKQMVSKQYENLQLLEQKTLHPDEQEPAAERPLAS